jgi:deoxyribose-phosphate aldolase
LNAVVEHARDILTTYQVKAALSPKVARLENLALAIDHTLLKPDATEASVRVLCEEALQYGFASVCIQPCWVGLAAAILKDSKVAVCTVIGFPLGANETSCKAGEARVAVAQGATEVDMVLNIGFLKSGLYDKVTSDISAVAQAADGALLKVILETAYLNAEEKVIACLLARKAGAAFVKTSTGFAPTGATLDDVKLMRHAVGSRLGVKASGGIKDTQTALAMLTAGANRLGTSAGVAIVQGGVADGAGY